MCTVTYFQHKDCKHMWAAVTEPCGPWMGFSTCASFVTGEEAKPAPRVYRTRTRPCPRCWCWCGLARASCRLHQHDANTVRVVERMGWGVKLGAGPDEADWGMDVRFSARGGRCVVL